MNSVVLKTAARMILAIMLLVAIFILIRGHNRPGGGFIAALITASALSLFLIAFDRGVLLRLLRVDIKIWLGIGLLCLLVSTMIGVFYGHVWLTGHWFTVAGVSVGTPLLFDIGVYLVVIGAVMTIVLELEG